MSNTDKTARLIELVERANNEFEKGGYLTADQEHEDLSEMTAILSDLLDRQVVGSVEDHARRPMREEIEEAILAEAREYGLEVTPRG